MARDKYKLNPEQKVLRYIREHHLITPRQKLVVAASGGPDSVCLLHILSELREELDITLHIAHLNHRLRGKDSDADAAYVGELARKLRVPATIEARNVKSYRSRHRLSLEEAAREVRYSFLVEVAAAVKAERVAVGHTTHDHVETILMHLIRGSGTRGLRGLLPLIQWQLSGNEITIIRPLLELTHEETVTYCRRHRLHPHADASNLSQKMFRNRIRHELLPLLRNYNPQVAEALRRTAYLVADDFNFIAKESARVWDSVAHREGDAIILNRKKLLTLPSALKRQLLRATVEFVLGNLKDIEAGHIEDMLAALEKPAGKAIDLPEGLTFTIEYDRYVLAPESFVTCPFPALETECTLNVPGKTYANGWEIIASVTTPMISIDEINEIKDFTACFDYDKTGNVIKVRHCLVGDRFQPLGLINLKKLSTFMIDARIPRSWRGRIPIVTTPEQVIWVAGWRLDERIRVTDKTKKILHLEFKRA